MSRKQTAGGGWRTAAEPGTLTVRDRFLAWIVTGPLARLVAFAIDLAAALVRGAIKRLKLRRR